MTRRLYRSSSNKVIGGVCGGLGEYLDIDPTLLRLIAVIGVLASAGFLVVAYLLGWIVIPQMAPGEQVVREAQPIQPPHDRPRSKWRTYLPGLVLVGLGAIYLALRTRELAEPVTSEEAA